MNFCKHVKGRNMGLKYFSADNFLKLIMSRAKRFKLKKKTAFQNPFKEGSFGKIWWWLEFLSNKIKKKNRALATAEFSPEVSYWTKASDSTKI